jgi:phosphotriesterase-related protein
VAPRLVTTLGDLAAHELGAILPHEHIVGDLRPLSERMPDERHPVEAIRALMEPEVRAAQRVGVTAIVDATPVGVGRRPDAIEAISRETGMPIAMATGVYREPWVPDWVRDSSSSRLTDWMLQELHHGIHRGTTRAAWIKLSAQDDGMTAEEERILRAAARAGRETGCAIGSHTFSADVVHSQLDVLESEGFPPERFIWIHAQVEPDVQKHLELARRGCWVEYDGIGYEPTFEEYIRLIELLGEHGFSGQILVSQDSGWYDPGAPDGGLARGPFTTVHDVFLPLLRGAGFDEAFVERLTVENPFRAYARV